MTEEQTIFVYQEAFGSQKFKNYIAYLVGLGLNHEFDVKGRRLAKLIRDRLPNNPEWKWQTTRLSRYIKDIVMPFLQLNPKSLLKINMYAGSITEHFVPKQDVNSIYIVFDPVEKVVRHCYLRPKQRPSMVMKSPSAGLVLLAQPITKGRELRDNGFGADHTIYPSELQIERIKQWDAAQHPKRSVVPIIPPGIHM